MNDFLEPPLRSITPEQRSALQRFADRGKSLTAEALARHCLDHCKRTANAHATNPMINLRLAEALASAIQQALDRWDSLSAPHRYWLAGAALYFARSNDDEPDFASPIGFEDDAEILNACLKFAGLDHLCVNPEDYDDV